jgi:flagellar motor switch protein FliG
MTRNQDALRKAAVLIAALDVDAADALLERMTPEQAGEIRRLLLELPVAELLDEQAVIGAFLDEHRGTKPEPVGVELSLSSTLRAAAMAPGRGEIDARPPFRFLHEAAVDDLGELLANEGPQTVAVVVSHLPADQAARTLAVLPEALQTEVVRRLAHLDEADPAVLREVELALERRLRRRLPLEGGRAFGVGAVKQILSEAAPENRQQWLANLSQEDPPLVAKLTRPSFTFDELGGLTDESLVLVFQTVDRPTAVAALAGSEPDFMNRLTALLPRAQAAQLRRAVDTLGPTRLSDVDAAQEATAHTAHELESLGRLTWRTSEPAATATREVLAA